MFNLGSSKGMDEISFFENSNRPSAKGVFRHDLSLKILPERQASLPNMNLSAWNTPRLRLRFSVHFGRKFPACFTVHNEKP